MLRPLFFSELSLPSHDSPKSHDHVLNPRSPEYERRLLLSKSPHRHSPGHSSSLSSSSRKVMILSSASTMAPIATQPNDSAPYSPVS